MAFESLRPPMSTSQEDIRRLQAFAMELASLEPDRKNVPCAPFQHVATQKPFRLPPYASRPQDRRTSNLQIQPQVHALNIGHPGRRVLTTANTAAKNLPLQSRRNGKLSSLPSLSSFPLARRARATLDRMSGSSLRSPYGSKSPRPRCQSTVGSNGAASPPMTGRERLAIQLLAGQSPTRPRTSSIGGGSGGAPGVPVLPPGYSRQRVASTYAPGASASGGRARSFVPAPSALGPGAGASPGYATLASPPDSRGRTYQLDVEQHPERTAEFGPAVLSRLALAPAPIVKLTIRDHTGSPIDPNTELPFLVAHLSLCTENGVPLEGGVSGATSAQQLLYGTLVSSAQVLRNLRGRVAPYFIFPDVSIRQRGRYCLNITLLRLPGIGGTHSGSRAEVLASVYTQVFEVVSQSIYVAPPPSALTQLFIRQGARMYAFESSLNNPHLLD